MKMKQLDNRKGWVYAVRIAASELNPLGEDPAEIVAMGNSVSVLIEDQGTHFDLYSPSWTTLAYLGLEDVVMPDDLIEGFVPPPEMPEGTAYLELGYVDDCPPFHICRALVHAGFQMYESDDGTFGIHGTDDQFKAFFGNLNHVLYYSAPDLDDDEPF